MRLIFSLALVLLSASCRPKTTAPAAREAAAPSASASQEGGPPGNQKPAPEAAAPMADDALPTFSSDELTTRARHLLEAIQKDDPSLATDIVFPRDAYLAVKDVPDPGKHWDSKILGAFKSQVHALHRHTKGVDHAIFTSFELGQPAAEALPKKHDLKRMLWRSKRSRLGFTIDGKPAHFDILEMTGWRGAWYVTKLK